MPSLYELLRCELIQRTDEGCAVPAAIRQRFAELAHPADAWNYQAINPIYDALMSLEPDPALAQREPNELHEIRRLRPMGPRDLRWCPKESELFERLHGAWTGRVLGCALGKPVECLGFLAKAGSRARAVGGGLSRPICGHEAIGHSVIFLAEGPLTTDYSRPCRSQLHSAKI